MSKRWTPVLTGKVFCSPACGHGCTLADYEKALGDADALCAKLGEGWKPRVWENLGWWYEAISPCGCVKVSSRASYGVSGYSTFLNVKGSAGGRWIGDGETPQRAVRDAVAKAVAERDEINKILGGLSEWMSTSIKPRSSAKPAGKKCARS